MCKETKMAGNVPITEPMYFKSVILLNIDDLRYCEVATSSKVLHSGTDTTYKESGSV